MAAVKEKMRSLLLIVMGLLVAIGSTEARAVDVFQTTIVNPADEHEIRSVVAAPDGWTEHATRGDSLAGVTLVHGLGSWGAQAVRWVPFAIELARQGYVAVYPDVRTKTPPVGATDCVAVADWLTGELCVQKESIAIIGGSAGDPTALATVQLHPGVYAAHVDLYGVVRHPRWDPTPPDLVASITAVTLMQVGADDPFLDAMRAWDACVGRWNPCLPHDLRVYPGGHGFFFLDGPGAEAARRELVEFLEWTLRGPKRPGWFQG